MFLLGIDYYKLSNEKNIINKNLECIKSFDNNYSCKINNNSIFTITYFNNNNLFGVYKGGCNYETIYDEKFIEKIEPTIIKYFFLEDKYYENYKIIKNGITFIKKNNPCTDGKNNKNLSKKYRIDIENNSNNIIWNEYNTVNIKSKYGRTIGYKFLYPNSWDINKTHDDFMKILYTIPEYNKKGGANIKLYCRTIYNENINDILKIYNIKLFDVLNNSSKKNYTNINLGTFKGIKIEENGVIFIDGYKEIYDLINSDIYKKYKIQPEIKGICSISGEIYSKEDEENFNKILNSFEVIKINDFYE